MVILEAIHRHSLATPDKIALYEGDEAVTYAGLWAHILGAASYFSSVGRRGDRVLLAASKSVAFVYAYFGAHLAGLIAVPVDPEINENRLQRILASARPLHMYGQLSLAGYEVLPFPVAADAPAAWPSSDSKETPFALSGNKETDSKETSFALSRSKEASFPFSGSEEAACPSSGSEATPSGHEREAASTAPLPAPFLFPLAGEPADILFTTGTTGLPKGVVLTHANEWAAATQINTFIGNDAASVELLALPVSHSFGLGRLRCILQLGATLDLLGSFASMKKFYRELDTRGITGFGMVPASWQYIRKMSGKKIENYASRLRYIEIGSAAMPAEEKQYLLSALPHTRICMHYGLTEASRSAFICFNDAPGQLASIGRPAPGVDIRILGENGAECVPGEEGELCVRGGQVSAGYWGEEASRHAGYFYGDYFRTGDWGYASADGWLYLKSRKKELINVGGKKVSPVEIEEVLHEIPGIKESACIGIPDPVLGEVVKAYIVWEGEEPPVSDRILRQTAARLENYKVPAAIEFIPELPKTASGKIQRLYLK